MFDSLGNYVVSIHRLAIGNLVLSDFDIMSGEYHEMILDLILENVSNSEQKASNTFGYN